TARQSTVGGRGEALRRGVIPERRGRPSDGFRLGPQEAEMSHCVSRRQFLGCSAAAGGVLLAPGLAANLAAAQPAAEGWPKPPPIRIHHVFVGRTGDIYLSRPTEEI